VVGAPPPPRKWYTDRRGRHRPITGGARKAAFAAAPLTIVNKPSLQLPVGAAVARSALDNPILLDYHKTAARTDVQEAAFKQAKKGATVIVSSIGHVPESSREHFEKHHVGVQKHDAQKGPLLESGKVHVFVDDRASWRERAKKEGVKALSPRQFVKKYG